MPDYWAMASSNLRLAYQGIEYGRENAGYHNIRGSVDAGDRWRNELLLNPKIQTHLVLANAIFVLRQSWMLYQASQFIEMVKTLLECRFGQLS